MKSYALLIPLFRRRLTAAAAVGWLFRAYLEPGSTSFLLKIIIASLTAIVLTLRSVRNMLRILWVRLTGQRPAKPAAASPDSDEIQPPGSDSDD